MTPFFPIGGKMHHINQSKNNNTDYLVSEKEEKVVRTDSSEIQSDKDRELSHKKWPMIPEIPEG